MAQEATATVQMDENGRVTIPKGVRQALGVEGQEAYISLAVTLIEQEGDVEQ